MNGVTDLPLLSLLVVLPLAGSAGALLAGLRGSRQGVLWISGISLAAQTIFAGWIAAYTGVHGTVREVVGGWSVTTGITVMIGPATALVLLVVLAVALAIHVYAAGSPPEGMVRTTVFFVVYGIVVSGLAATILAEDLFNLFVSLEVVSLGAVVLVAYRRTPRSMIAALRYLVISTVTIALYLVGLLILYRQTGELGISRVAQALMATPPAGRAVPIALALIVTGLTTRVASVPFHVWLPDAHSEAPHPVSALLSGLVLKAAFLALYRVYLAFAPAMTSLVPILMAMGAVSALLGVILALAQRSAKRLLAFHSVSQMGLILVGIGGTGALVHAASHAAFKSLLFLVVGVLATRRGTADIYELRTAPAGKEPGRWEQAFFLIGAGAIAGVPGLSGFVGKGLITTSVRSVPFLQLLVQLVSVGSAASFIKLGTAFFPRVVEPAAATTTPPSSNRLAPLTLAGMAIPGAITILIGVAGGIHAGLFTVAKGGNALATLAIGAVLFRLLVSSPGKSLAGGLSGVRLGLDSSLTAILLGAVVLAMVV